MNLIHAVNNSAFKRAYFSFLLVMLFISNPTSCIAAVLQSIDIFSTKTKSQVVIQLSETTRYRQHTLPAIGNSPERCYVDLFSTSRALSIPQRKNIDDDLILRIRTGLNATTSRVVIDLKSSANCSLVTTEDPFRLIFTVKPGRAPIKTGSGPVKRRSNIAKTELEEKVKITLPASQQKVSPPQVKEANKAASEEETRTRKLTKTKLIIAETESLLAQLENPTHKQPSFWGWIKAFSAVDTQDDFAEDQTFSRFKARLGADWKKPFDSDYDLQFSGSLNIDYLMYDNDYKDEETEPTIHEAYLQLNNSSWDLSFGKQRVRWGKSDQLSPVDSLNPQDLRQSLTVELEERAIPSWMLRGRWHGKNIGLETVLQPWFKKSELDYFDSDWALYRNLRQAIVENPAAPAIFRMAANNLVVSENKPAHTLENMSGGLRITWQTEQTDYALSYHYTWETLPTITNFPVKNIDFSGDPNADLAPLLETAIPTAEKVVAEYKRQQRAGFEWETVLDPIGFRGEIVHIDNVAFLRSDLTSVRKPVTHLVTGIDYTSESEWYFNLQGSWHHIHDYEKNILYLEENTVSALGELSKPLWRGNIELSLKYNYTINDESSYLQPAVNVKYFQNVNLELGAMVFSGDRETLLGSYDHADQLYALFKISF